MSKELETIIKTVNSGKNIFLSGPGGAGKSWCIGELFRNFNLSITSTTGVSAINVNGETIHRFTGIGIVKENALLDDVLKKVRKNKKARENIKNCEILVIDEISMLSADIIEILDYLFKQIRKNPKVFGGIQVIFTGDFYQLPPISGDYCFLSPIWHELKLKNILLTGNYRFTDKKYPEILSRIRVAEPLDEDIEILNGRYHAYKEMNSCDKSFGIKPTFLYTTNVNVDAHNISELNKLETPEVFYEAQDICEDPLDPQTLTILESMAPIQVKLKKGAQVMITTNISVETGLANGTRGIIEDLTKDYVKIKILNGSSVFIQRHQYVYGKNKEYIREQIPLKLAYSITVHKSQGASIDFAVIDLYRIFAPSQVYVALSRVRNLEGLFLTNKINTRDIYIDENVKNFYSWYCS